MDEDRLGLPERLRELLREGDVQGASSAVDDLEGMSSADKKAVLNSLAELADESTRAIEPVLPALTSSLEADERAIRLTTAKLLVSIAETDPEMVVPLCPSLADRLADEDEFYYVRARSAEALGYVALDLPDEAISPDVLADLRIGLSFDEPEVKQKLAKALEYVALGNPRRLRHQASNLAAHLADEDELVRYHLCTALVSIGTRSPAHLADVTSALVERLDDECPFVRGRAVEALGHLAHEGGDGATLPKPRVAELLESDEPFVADRARFAYRGLGGAIPSDDAPAAVGTIESVRETTAAVAEEIESPDLDGECRHCGLPLSEDGPPLCPRCGGPC